MSQPLPLRDQLNALQALQELDLKIDEIKKKKNAIPTELKSLNDSVLKAKHAVDAKKNALAELEKNKRQTSAALELNADRMTRANTKMEGVHNGQEFQAASKEIEQLKKAGATLEEQQKKIAADIELANKDIETLSSALAQAQAGYDAKATELNSQGGMLDADINGMVQDRSKHTTLVEPRIMTQYERVRAARGGLGIVPAVGGRCKGCNMMVPPQMYNEVQRGQTLHSCPSCHRILFMPAQQDQQPSQGRST